MKNKIISAFLILIILLSICFIVSHRDTSSRLVENETMNDAKLQVHLQNLFKIAKEYINNSSAVGDNFDIGLRYLASEYAVFNVFPRKIETDNAILVLKKVSGNWQGIALGTAFPELGTEHPEIFLGDKYSYVDITFDGYVDRIEEVDCAATGNCLNVIDRFDPVKKEFVAVYNDGKDIENTKDPAGGLTVIINPEVNNKEKIVCSFSKGGGGYFTYMIYGYSNGIFYPKKEITVEPDIENTELIRVSSYSNKTKVPDSGVRISAFESFIVPTCTLEVFINIPGAVKSITDQGDGQWLLTVDILTHNSKWTPGGDEMLFINQSTKVRNLLITKDSKNYTCEDRVYESTTSLISRMKMYLASIKAEQEAGIKPNDFVYNFDIDGNVITATYKKCSS